MFLSSEGLDRRKEEERVRREGRLPPGQSLTLKFPVLHYGPVPHFNPATWDFRVWGDVEEEKSWTWDQFNQLPRTKIQMDIHCVTRWSKFDTVWEGVSVKAMVENGLFRIKPTVTHVMQHAEYGFTVNLPLEVVLQDNFLLATHFNGEPISPTMAILVGCRVAATSEESGNALFLERCQMAPLAGVHAA
jgi:DMSO/TMAO reductase YedYZ molybdopterin-dependent catalytic subunit